MKINDRFYVKIVPQRGDTIHRFWVRRRHIAAACCVLALVVLGSLLFAGVQVLHARSQVAGLRSKTEDQQKVLTSIDEQTEALRKELQQVQHQNQEIRQLIGAPAPTHSPGLQRTSWVRRGPAIDTVAANLQALSSASSQTASESNRIKNLALRILNLQHIHALQRAAMIAAIPSIDPVDGAEVVGCFCYRSYPDSEFHKGVDLGADYGENVRAAAAGTVVANDYDGAYGIKVDIDHGNGYHTWYAHLSRAEVTIGQHVYKGQSIGAVGATGFATGPHLHYQLMYQGQAIDPTPFLHGVPSNVLASLP
ncbi:MAG TPA: M23 family metallopeptidase [Candidatus Baltobacteraceae bacterium]|jgi:murein DD-endopeptidase MepM/ murein hydrolase activator NlpD|nr:M23 family metallopeptidase [Candidatus Baltobacteraceae bacterium]